jgi:hypothetical protein
MIRPKIVRRYEFEDGMAYIYTKEPFAIITPTRGDRPEFYGQSLKMANQFNASRCIRIDYEPIGDSVDISDRVMRGIWKAAADGIDLVFIVEDDDFYPADYIQRFGDLSNYHFFGSSKSTYYNLRNRTWQTFFHRGRSSLYNTGFRISAMKEFPWERLIRTNTPFLDIEIWKYARAWNKRCKFIENTGSIGIKHGIGLCGGKGHKMEMNNKDPEMIWLKARVDNDSFEFYKQLSESIK